MIKKLSFAAVIIAYTWSIQSCTENRGKSYAQKTKVDINGLNFIQNAHESGLTEIGASKLAKQKSANSQVTSFADMMISDHTALGVDVDTLAVRKFVFIRDSVNRDDKTALDSLATKTGAEFDKAYAEKMVADHEKAVDLFTENTTSNYTEIRDVAEKALPKLKEHLEAAKKLMASLK